MSDILAIYRIGKAGFELGDLHTFEQTFLDVARIAEMIGQRYESQRGLHLLERNVATAREESPSDALVNTAFWMVELFTDHKRHLRAYALLVSDALYVCARSFLEAVGFDERAAEIARSFFEELGDLALTAVRSLDGDSLWKTTDDMEQLALLPQFQRTVILRRVLASAAFHVGIATEQSHAS